jgi:hypothetical protein
MRTDLPRLALSAWPPRLIPFSVGARGKPRGITEEGKIKMAGGLQKKIMQSWIVKYRSTNGKPLLGGALAAKSARWGRKADAETYLASILRENSEAQPTGKIVPVQRPPEVFPHCLTAMPQAIGSRCTECGHIITLREAMSFGETENSRKITGQKLAK